MSMSKGKEWKEGKEAACFTTVTIAEKKATEMSRRIWVSILNYYIQSKLKLCPLNKHPIPSVMLHE